MDRKAFRIFLTPKFESSDKYESNAIQFDVVDSYSVSMSASLTQYPTINGDLVADHLVRNATNSDISGTFSLIGDKPTSFSGGNDRLSNIQKFFEYLMQNAILCNITTKNLGNTSTTRFESRDNMVLTSIRWTEKQSSLDFMFSFTEALLSETQFDDITDIDTSSDANLPDITDPTTLSFSQTLLDWTYVDYCILGTLYNDGMISKDFLNYYISSNSLEAFGKTMLVGIAAGVGGLAIGGAVGVGVGVLFGSGVGIPIGIAVSVIAALAIGIAGLVNCIQTLKAKNSYSIKQFKLYQDDRKNQEECNRLDNWLGQIHKNLQQLDNAIKLYQFRSSIAQECQLYIDGEYYVFRVTRVNVDTSTSLVKKSKYSFNIDEEDISTTWTLTVTKLGSSSSDVQSLYSASGTIIQNIPDLSSYAISSTDECTNRKPLFYTGNGTEVWLVSLASGMAMSSIYDKYGSQLKTVPTTPDWLTRYDEIYQEVMKEYPYWIHEDIEAEAKIRLEKEQKAYKEEVNETTSYNSKLINLYYSSYLAAEKSKLTNYLVMTSTFKMSEYNEKLKALIENGMKYND